MHIVHAIQGYVVPKSFLLYVLATYKEALNNHFVHLEHNNAPLLRNSQLWMALPQ